MDFENLFNNEDDEILQFIKELKNSIIETKKYLSTHNLTNEQLMKAKAISVLFLNKTIDEFTEYQDVFPLDNMEKNLLSLIKGIKEEIEQLFDSYMSK